MQHLSKTQKDDAESLLRRAISLIYRDKPAEALNCLAETLDIMRRHYGPELAKPVALAHGGTVEAINVDAMLNQIAVSPKVNSLIPAQRGAVCPSLLPAVLAGNAIIKTECPLCGLYHDHRVNLVPLSDLGLFMLERGSSMRIKSNPEQYAPDDVVVFYNQKYQPDSRDLWRTSVVGRITKIFSTGYGSGLEAVVAVEQ